MAYRYRGQCRYCGNPITGGDMCHACRDKYRLAHKIRRIGVLIRERAAVERAEQERMERERMEKERRQHDEG